MAVWCSEHNLELNPLKTVEMVVDFRKSPPPLVPLTINNTTVKEVEAFKFLGTTITNDLKWETNTCSIIKRAHSGMFFLRQLRKVNVSPPVLTQFYRATTESILSSSISVWFGSVSALAKNRLQRIVRTAG